ncbi:MAG: NAD(P)/FAD-dependent oxidoreductase [Nocardioidaceae bacterium]
MNSTADAVVVGAGVIGSSIALELSKAGRTVVVVDKAGSPGDGSTSASSAIVRFNYSTLAGVRAAWESRSCWEGWADHLGHRDPLGTASLRRIGMIHLDVPVMPRAPVLRLFDQVGIPYDELDAEQLVERFPALDNGSYWPNKPVTDDAFWADSTSTLGGFYTPDAGYVDDPRLAAQNLAAGARSRGAAFRFRAEVSAVQQRRSGGWLVDLADGDSIDTPVVVNAAGPWSTRLNRLAGVGGDFTVEVRPMRQEVHEVTAPDGYNTDDERLGPAIADVDLGTYMRPGPHNTFLVGGTEPACDAFEWVDDPDGASPRVTRDRFEAQVTRAARRLPALRVPTRPAGVAGVYDVAEDWTPIYDRTDAAGFYVAMATSGNQFKNAPVVGRLMSTLIDRVESGDDHDTSPVTYVGEHTGQPIDLGTFSRKRPKNPASTGTVMG